MKRTGLLKILHDTAFPVNRIVIHPNTGFDLGFMQLKYVSNLYINTGIEEFKNGTAEPFCSVDIMLLNECGPNNVEMAQKLWDQLGRPEKAILVYNEDGNRLFLAVK